MGDISEKDAARPAEQGRSHRRIAWRLSGRILAEQIAAFFAIDILLAFLIGILHVNPGMFPDAPWLNNAWNAFGYYIEKIQWIDITSVKVLAVVGGLEILALVVSTLRLRGAIKAQLAPLRELREAADALTGVAQRAETGEDADGMGAAGRVGRKDYSIETLKRMADALNRVDARDMDAHLSADAVSEELRPLAAAINDMLHRLDASYAAQTKFVSDASHELRTPIAVIQGYANILSRWGSEDPSTLRESIEAIESEAESMKQLVNQLLFLARGDNETLPVDMRRMAVGPVLAEVLREVALIDGAQGAQGGVAGGRQSGQMHEIRADIPDAPVWIRGDAALIKQLVRVLVDNSIKYTAEGGGIKIALSSDGARAHIIVQDEGQGIAPDVLPHIFDRFVRADEARARNTGGSGLGLSIARQIAGLHSGVVEVYSKEGLGSRFTVTLPLF
jgi:signal transduction histidine kinase